MFYQGDDRADGGVVRVGGAPPGEVLRITRVVDDNARNFHARPSPDGMLVAFDSDRDGERAVYVADADGHTSGGSAAMASRRFPAGRLTVGCSRSCAPNPTVRTSGICGPSSCSRGERTA